MPYVNNISHCSAYLQHDLFFIIISVLLSLYLLLLLIIILPLDGTVYAAMLLYLCFYNILNVPTVGILKNYLITSHLVHLFHYLPVHFSFRYKVTVSHTNNTKHANICLKKIMWTQPIFFVYASIQAIFTYIKINRA